ncbi:MAG: S24/S26 family peptidase [Clostridia bacterium]|nr:S24/S26 family peptidase [Clostridia bacterium]
MGIESINEKNLLRTIFLRQIKIDNLIEIRGFSMEPTYYAGDKVKVETAPCYKVGDVVIAIDDPCRLLIHRVVEVIHGAGDEGIVYKIKGDNAEACEMIPAKYCLAKVTEDKQNLKSERRK